MWTVTVTFLSCLGNSQQLAYCREWNSVKIHWGVLYSLLFWDCCWYLVQSWAAANSNFFTLSFQLLPRETRAGWTGHSGPHLYNGISKLDSFHKFFVPDKKRTWSEYLYHVSTYIFAVYIGPKQGLTGSGFLLRDGTGSDENLNAKKNTSVLSCSSLPLSH